MNYRGQGAGVGGFDIGTELGGGGGGGKSSGGADKWSGVSQWQVRRHTLRKIEKILQRSKHNTEGVVVTDTNSSIGAGKVVVLPCSNIGDPAEKTRCPTEQVSSSPPPPPFRRKLIPS